MKLIFQLVPFLALALRVRAHGVLTAISGTNGVTGQGFGVIASTPRDGSTRNPFEQDTSIINDAEIRSGKASVCGRTLAGGSNDVATQLNAAVAAGLPSAAEDGTLTMTLHQVNGDGAGPYTCEVSTDATGTSFAAMTVTTNVPGKNSRSNAKATDFALVAQMPPGTTCTGGTSGNACLVRCKNSAAAGPFGGCAAVTTAGSGNTTTTATTTGSTSDTSDVASTSSTTATGSTSDTSDTTAAGTTSTDGTAADTGAGDESTTADTGSTDEGTTADTGSTDEGTTADTGSTGEGTTADTGSTDESATDAGSTDEGTATDTGSTSDESATDTDSAAATVATGAAAVASTPATGAESTDTDAADGEEADDDDADETLDRRVAERVRRSRIVGRRFF